MFVLKLHLNQTLSHEFFKYKLNQFYLYLDGFSDSFIITKFKIKGIHFLGYKTPRNCQCSLVLAPAARVVQPLVPPASERPQETSLWKLVFSHLDPKMLFNFGKISIINSEFVAIQFFILK